MFREQFPLRFVLGPFRLDLRDSYYFRNAGGELGGECGRGDDIFVDSLWVGGYETDGCSFRGVEGVGDEDFCGL